jgi:uncharacterized protein YukE
MKTYAVLAALVLAGAAPCAAQQAMKSGPKQLSPEQAQAQKGIMLMRDSVLAAQSALRQLQRDYEKAAPRTLEGWAGQAAERCAAAERTSQVARALVAGPSFIPAEMARGQKDMVAAIDKSRTTLGSCQSTFKPLAAAGKGEEVRAYGNYRAKPLLKQLEKFDQAVHNAIHALDLDVREVLKAGKAPA